MISKRRQRAQTTVSRLAAITATTTMVIAGVVLGVGTPTPAAAVPGTPGIPGPSTVLYLEDFDNAAENDAVSLNNYVSASGVQYTASSYWLNRAECNGMVVSLASPVNSVDCDDVANGNIAIRQRFQTTIRQMVSALASLSGADANTNSGLGELANLVAPSGELVFATQSNIPLNAAGRYLLFSVDAAATTCTQFHANLNFYAVDDGGNEIPLNDTPIDPCVDPRSSVLAANTAIQTGPVYGGRYASDQSVLITGSTLGIRLRNVTTATGGNGNDFAIDNIQILDGTPQLDKEFSTETVAPGGVGTLTFTVTNTQDLASKLGWSFSDALPTGMTIASTPSVVSTCDASVTAGAGSSQIAVTAGNLDTGEVSCQISVDVTASALGAYSNGPGNITTNTLVPPDVTVLDVGTPSFVVSKTPSAAVAAPGDVITYTISVENTGDVAYGPGAPDPWKTASFVDHLGAVLQGAVYNGDATHGAVLSGNDLVWSGPLAVGEVIEVTFSVTVTSGGDGLLINVVVPSSNGGHCKLSAYCFVLTQVTSYDVTKTADVDEVIPGSTVTYTLTVHNTGRVAYTAANPASLADDLSAVLDDGQFVGVNASAGTATLTGNTLTWSGPLALDETVTIVYQISIDDPGIGDGRLVNVVETTAPGGSCRVGIPNPACSVSIPSGAFTVAKSASSAVADPGATVTYEVTVDNTGDVDYTVAVPAAFTDDLSGVLDDAAYVPGSATGGATVSGSTLSWAGALAQGDQVTIQYQVVVGAGGDNHLVNSVAPSAGGGGCPTAGGCTTDTAVRTFTVAKTADASSARFGAVIRYTIVVTNSGAVDFTQADPASLVDDLSDVLDDAAYNGDVSGNATFAALALSWSGVLPIGATHAIRYSVTAADKPGGDQRVVNSVLAAGSSNCRAGLTAPDCTTFTSIVPSFLASTGGTIAAWLAALGGVFLVGGTLIVIRRRRQRRPSVG